MCEYFVIFIYILLNINPFLLGNIIHFATILSQNTEFNFLYIKPFHSQVAVFFRAFKIDARDSDSGLQEVHD